MSPLRFAGLSAAILMASGVEKDSAMSTNGSESSQKERTNLARSSYERNPISQVDRNDPSHLLRQSVRKLENQVSCPVHARQQQNLISGIGNRHCTRGCASAFSIAAWASGAITAKPAAFGCSPSSVNSAFSIPRPSTIAEK